MAAFSLLRLPLIPVKLVIGLMEVEDQIKLSMTSMKTEEFIKWINYFLSNFDIHLSNETPYFNICRTQQNYCDVRFNIVKGEKFDTKYLNNWYKDQSDQVIDLKSMNPIKDVMNLSERLRPLFKVRFLEWKLELKKSQAFSFHYSEYKNGLWVKIEDLLSIRNRHVINLETTNFDCNDINRFLHYWANCEHDMMHSLYFNLKKGVEKDTITLLRQITFFQVYDLETPTYFILSQKDEDTKCLIGRIQFLKNSIEFSTWKKVDYGNSYVLPVLKMLYRQYELIAKYAKIRSEENRYNEEWNQATNGSIERARVEEELRRFRLLKEDMETEFNKVIVGLESNQITGYVQNIN